MEMYQMSSPNHVRACKLQGNAGYNSFTYWLRPYWLLPGVARPPCTIDVMRVKHDNDSVDIC